MGGLCEGSSLALSGASISLEFRPGQVVYRQGDQAAGAYIIISGKVKLTTASSVGKTLTIRVAEPGDLIGLSAALAGCGNDTTAVANESAIVSFVPTEALYRLMSCYIDVSLHLAEQLSSEYHCLCRELSLLGLQRSAMSRLARLLIRLFDNVLPNHGAAQVTCGLTHEEIGQLIGTSRETVTRLFRELRKADIAALRKHTLHVNSLERLRSLT